jgi:tRNA-specific 2-thiouridylase
VFRYFLADYRQGKTPNPDILCNKEIKFNTFLHYAQRLGAEFIATGHYVRQITGDGRHHLLKGADTHKDQSYFLATLTQAQLSKSLFPLGDLEKYQVRELASSAGLITHDKKDSTGICFIGERKFRQFLNHYLPAQPGDIRTLEGERLGQHMGVMFYTLGQRQGLGIGGRGGSSGEPWYVVDKHLRDNVLMVAQGHHHPLLYHQRLRASQLSWIGGEPPQIPLPCCAKTRYRQTEQACIIERLDENLCQVFFHEPQRAITPGQAVVFYTDDECLGGGIIDTAFD